MQLICPRCGRGEWRLTDMLKSDQFLTVTGCPVYVLRCPTCDSIVRLDLCSDERRRPPKPNCDDSQHPLNKLARGESL